MNTNSRISSSVGPKPKIRLWASDGPGLGVLGVDRRRRCPASWLSSGRLLANDGIWVVKFVDGVALVSLAGYGSRS